MGSRFVTVQQLRKKTDWHKLGGMEENNIIMWLADMIPSQARIIIESYIPKELHESYAYWVTTEHNKKGYINECKKS